LTDLIEVAFYSVGIIHIVELRWDRARRLCEQGKIQRKRRWQN
jgi:hypothetical protein